MYGVCKAINRCQLERVGGARMYEYFERNESEDARNPIRIGMSA